MFASTLPSILQELADSVLLFVYLSHSSMSTRYDQSILSTIGQNGKAFVDSWHSKERKAGCMRQIYKLCFDNRLDHHGVLK